jgi:hypothetical protein
MLNAGMTVSGTDLMEAIRRRAYGIWLSEGCPHGRDRIHWLRAEAEVRERFKEAHLHCCKTGLHERPAPERGENIGWKRAAQFARNNQEAGK